MQEQGLDFSDYLAAFKRRRLSITAIAVTVFLIGALAAWLWPATYKSSATILIKEQDIPPELVQSVGIGTRVRVVNKENGKAVVVRINDRGPFVEGRVIDVSFRAAEDLDMIQAGLVRCRVEVLSD